MKIVLPVLMGLVLLSCAAETEPLSESVDSATASAETTSDRIASIQQRLQRQDSAAVADEPVYRIDQERFAPFRQSDGRIEFKGASLADVEKALGKPFDSKQSGDRAVVLHRVYPDDSTTLYLFATGGKVERFRLDEFNGWEGSSALSWFNY